MSKRGKNRSEPECQALYNAKAIQSSHQNMLRYL